MGEIQRYCFVTNPPPHIPHVQETNKGEWVRFTDHVEAVRAAVTERDRETGAAIAALTGKGKN